MNRITITLISFFMIIIAINCVSSADADDDLNDLTLDGGNVFGGLGNLFSVSHETEDPSAPLIFSADNEWDFDCSNLKSNGF